MNSYLPEITTSQSGTSNDITTSEGQIGYSNTTYSSISSSLFLDWRLDVVAAS